jgi:hypothetical protein
MKRTHRAKVLRVAVALMASSMAVGASISAVAAPVPPSPIQLLSEALAAARSEAAVELTSHEHAGTITATGITEAGRTDGTQSITVHRGAKSGHFVTVLIGTKAYLRANDFGLEVLGFDAVAANVEASRWLVIGPGSAYGQAAYEALVSGLTVSSVVSQLTPMNSEPLGLLPTTTVDAQTVVGLQVTVPAGTGVPAGHEVLYVRSGGQPLPVETVFTQGGSSNVTVFGPWGRPPAAFAEAGAIPVRPGWLAGHQPQGLGIPGSPGYSTFTGPLGGPMQAGRPWGKRCQPVLFDVAADVPRSIYTDVATVVGQAREAGLDVTIVYPAAGEWDPGLLYPPGQTLSTVEVVHIYAATGTAPILANGLREHIDLGWDARPAPDGEHEILTEAQGSLYLSVIAGQPLSARRAVRQLIALTQGILSSVASGSGIADGTEVDRFSVADIAAMQTMSGCHFQPTQVLVLPPQP